MSENVIRVALGLMPFLISVISRLREVGWSDELDRMQRSGYGPLQGHKHLQTTKQLTDHSTFSASPICIVRHIEMPA